jgi:integrase
MKEEIFYTDPVLKICYYRRGSNTIYVYFSCDGNRYRFSTRTSDFQKAAQIANQKYKEAQEGYVVQVKTIFQVYKEFIEFKRLESKKDSTINDYEATVKFIYEKFGKDRDVGTITKKDIGDFILWRSNYYVNQKKQQSKYKRNGKEIKGKGFEQNIASNRTINKTVGLLISILRFACFEREYITSDKIPSFTRLTEEIRVEFIDEKELGLIFTYLIDKKMLYQACVVLFCFYSGCRYPNELNKLIWENIDFKNKVILFMNRKSKGKKVVNTRFPMLPVLEEILSEIKTWHPDSHPEDYVFREKDGIQIKNIRKSFQSAIKVCGLEEKIKSMYGLRHSFATHWIHTKMPLNEIAHLMGHADTVMLERRYAHLVSDKVNEHFQDAYLAMNDQRGLTLIGKSKQHTVFENDSLEYYREKIKGKSIPPIVEELM